MIDYELQARKSLESLQKTITRGTLDTAMITAVINPILPFMHIKENPLLMLIPSEYASGRNFNWNQATEGSTPSEFVAEDGSPTVDDSTYALQTVAHKIQVGRGKVTRFAQETGANFADLLSTEVGLKMIGFWDIMEKQMIQGTVSATAPAGLYTLLPASQTVHNSTTSGGAVFDEMKLMEAIELCKANPTTGIIVSAARTWLQMNSIVLADRRHTDIQNIQIAGGAWVPTYQFVPWVKSTNVPITMTFDGSSSTALTGGSNSEIYIVNKNWCQRKWLRQPSYFPVETDPMYHEFYILSYWCLALINYLYCARVDGINVTNASTT